MIERGINSIDTSACGRLFDAVASISDVRNEVNFEAQAAIELEMSAAAGVDAVYPFDIVDAEPWQIDMRPAIEAMVRDVLAGVPQDIFPLLFTTRWQRLWWKSVAVCGPARVSGECASAGALFRIYSCWSAPSLDCERRASKYFCTPRFLQMTAGLR